MIWTYWEFNLLPVEGRVDRFQVLATTDTAAVDVSVWGFV